MQFNLQINTSYQSLIVKMKKRQEKATILYFQTVPVVELNLKQFTNDHSPIKYIDTSHRSQRGSLIKLRQSNITNKNKWNTNQSQLSKNHLQHLNKEVSPQLQSLLSKVKNQSSKVRYKIEKNKTTVANSKFTKQKSSVSSRIINTEEIKDQKQKENLKKRSTSRRYKIFGMNSKLFQNRKSSVCSNVSPIEIRLKSDISKSKLGNQLGVIGHCKTQVPKYTSQQIELKQSRRPLQSILLQQKKSIVIRNDCGARLSFEGQQWFTKLGRFCS